jgi:putative FmdB family regulatory protein
MPTYHYICPKCGHDYEKLQRISDSKRVKCPECGTLGERQISGGAGLVFKGSGFYVTDYGKAGEQRPSEGDKGSSEGDRKSSDKGDKKAAKHKPTKGKKQPPTGAGS